MENISCSSWEQEAFQHFISLNAKRLLLQHHSEILILQHQSCESSRHSLALVSSDQWSSFLWLPVGVASLSRAACWADYSIHAWRCSSSWHVKMCLYVFRIPGVFPESPRWLLLSERTGDMHSFSERQRDDDSFSGQFKTLLLLLTLENVNMNASSNISPVLEE